MELTSENVHRYFNILKFRLKKHRYKILKNILAYLYLFLTYTAIVYYFSFSIRIAIKPLSWFFLVLQMLGYFLLYVLLNHLFIRKVVSHKIMLIIEALLFIAIFTLIISDLRYEEYQHLQFLKRTATTAANM